MFKWVKFWTKSANPDSIRYKKELAKNLSGRKLKYITERINDEADDNGDTKESVIGRDGLIFLRGDELLIYAGENSSKAIGYDLTLFRTDVASLYASELLSGAGVIITAPDKEHDGETRSLVAYYSYYRK